MSNNITTMCAKEVSEYTKIPRSTLYRRINAGTFPAPLKTSDGNTVGWTIPYIEQFFERLQNKALEKMGI